MAFLALIAQDKDETMVQLVRSEFDGAVARAQEIVERFADSRNPGGYPESLRDLYYAFTVFTLDHNFDSARVICEVIFDLGRESADQHDL